MKLEQKDLTYILSKQPCLKRKHLKCCEKRCYAKTQTKQIKSHVSAYSFGETQPKTTTGADRELTISF